MERLDGWEVQTPNRPEHKIPRILDVTHEEDTSSKTNLLERSLIRVKGPTGLYYEGLDHSEAILALNDFMLTEHVSGDKIVLVNIDAHDDIEQGVFTPGKVRLNTWIRAANVLGFFNNIQGVHYIFRRYDDIFAPNPDTDASIESSFGIQNGEATGVRVVMINFDTVESDIECKAIFDRLLDLKNQGYHIVTSIDADAGLLTGEGESYYRDLTDISKFPWLGKLYQTSSAVMYFHSPGYSPKEYSSKTGIALQGLHSVGYQPGRRVA